MPAVLLAFALAIALAPASAFAAVAASASAVTRGEPGAGVASTPAATTATASAPATPAATTPAATATTASASAPATATTAAETPVASAQASTLTPAATPSSAQVRVSIAVIGPGEGGADAYWEQPTYERAAASEDAWAVTKRAFAVAGLAYDATEGTPYGTLLNTIASPFSGEVLGYYAATGKYWQLFVNGVSSDVGISSLALEDGDAIVWKYSAWGDASGTTTGALVYDDPATSLPSYSADWPQSEAHGSLVSAPTPTVGARALWSTLVGGGSSTSSPLLVNGRAYVAVGASFVSGSTGGAYATRLVRLDAETGTVEATGQLAGSISYTSRPLYADGMVFVALANGSVQALNAETMLTRWASAPLEGCSNAQCALRCEAGVVYVETASDLDAGGKAASGSVLALDEATGAVRWRADNRASGYNWTAAAVSGSTVVVGDTAGTLHALDEATGSETSSLSLGSSPVNADPVSYGDRLLVMTRDGVLHVVAVGPAGALSQEASLAVLGGCKAAPTVVGDMAVVAGEAAGGGSSALALVDLSAMSVERSVTKAAGADLPLGLGGIAGSVLVSAQADGTYCYFALNDATPTDKTYASYSDGGDVFVYRLGDDEASPLYLPGGASAQYCDYPLVCDGEGGLYYLNDSGYLSRLEEGPRPVLPATGGGTAPAAGSGAAASGTSSARVPLLPSALAPARLRSNATAGVTPGIPASLRTSSAPVAADGGQPASATPAADGDEPGVPVERRLPAWPVIGMCIGCAALLAALLWRRPRPRGEVA
jgi:outer membrane protein assembly factor BamB